MKAVGIRLCVAPFNPDDAKGIKLHDGRRDAVTGDAVGDEHAMRDARATIGKLDGDARQHQMRAPCHHAESGRAQQSNRQRGVGNRPRDAVGSPQHCGGPDCAGQIAGHGAAS